LRASRRSARAACTRFGSLTAEPTARCVRVETHPRVIAGIERRRHTGYSRNAGRSARTTRSSSAGIGHELLLGARPYRHRTHRKRDRHRPGRRPVTQEPHDRPPHRYRTAIPRSPRAGQRLTRRLAKAPISRGTTPGARRSLPLTGPVSYENTHAHRLTYFARLASRPRPPRPPPAPRRHRVRLDLRRLQPHQLLPTRQRHYRQ
jgi:hypothetical protein